MCIFFPPTIIFYFLLLAVFQKSEDAFGPAYEYMKHSKGFTNLCVMMLGAAFHDFCKS